MLNPPGVVPTLPKDAQFVAVGKPKAPVEPHPLTADQYIAEAFKPHRERHSQNDR